jgi:hypothetical protein
VRPTPRDVGLLAAYALRKPGDRQGRPAGLRRRQPCPLGIHPRATP